MAHKRSRKRGDRIQRRTLPGASPGTLVVDPQAPPPIIQLMCYDRQNLIERTVEDLSHIKELSQKWPVTWINVSGLGSAAIIEKLGEIFSIHRLVLEDVVNVHQRSKVEQYRNYYFIVWRLAESRERVSTEQLSLILGNNYVLTFQERTGNFYDPVRERLRKSSGQIRCVGPDYLAYALLDASIDHYFPVLEVMGERLEEFENVVIENPSQETISQIHSVRRDLLVLRRAVWPMREAINALLRESAPPITEDTKIYFRDCYDHTVQIIDLLENYRDIASSMMEVYLSSLSMRMNEIMKVLTIFAAVFIPLTLIAGIYGMNFNPEASPWNLPELNWFYGYPFALGLMVLVALGMLVYFRKKGWLGSGNDKHLR